MNYKTKIPLAKSHLVVLCYFALSSCHAQAIPDSLSLQSVLNIVIERNPILKQAEGKIGISDAQIGISKSNRYPKVSLEGSLTYVDPVSAVSIPLGENQITLPLFPNDNWDAHAGVQYMLYDFGRTTEIINISKIERLIAEEGLEAAQKQLTYTATELFNTILFTENAIEVQEKLVRSLSRNLKRVNGFIKNGMATAFDRVNTKVRITAAENRKVGLQNSLSKLKHGLKELMGMDSDLRELSIKGALDIEDQRIALSGYSISRNDLIIAKHIDSILLSGQKLANKGNLPFLAIGGATGFRNGYMPVLDDFRFNYAVFAKVTVPLFQGFKVKHERDMAKIKIENSKWHLNEIETKINTELAFAKESLDNAFTQYDNNKILIEQAEIAVQQARKKHDNQLITNLDLLDTEVALAGAQLALLESKYRCIMAHYKIQQAQGAKIW